MTHALKILNSPLLGRELRLFFRSHKSFICLFLFLSALLLVVSQNWSAFTYHFQPGEDISRGSRALFFMLVRGHLFTIVLLMPILMAPAIAEERDKSTLDMILSSPISIFHLVAAKFIMPVLYVCLLLTAAMPVLALCFIGGGLDINDVFLAYLILLSATVLYGSLGLLCSTLPFRIYGVYLVAIVATLVFVLLIPYHGMVWHYITRVRYSSSFSINHGFQYLSPFFSLGELIRPTVTKKGSLDFLWLHLVLSACVSLFFLYAAVLRVGLISSGERSGWDEDDDDEDESHPLLAKDRGYDITFGKTSEEGNPGMILERRVQWFSRMTVLMRLFYSAFMISVLTLPLASYQGSWLFLTIPFISAAFFTLPLSATSISSDRERETFGLLRTSLLSTRQIVYAKFITGLQYSFLIALALYLPGMLVQLLCGLMLGMEVDLVSGRGDTFAIMFYPVTLFFSLVLYNSWGLFCSAVFRQSSKALIVSGLVILITLSAPFMIPRLDLSSLSVLSYFLTFGLMFLSPLAGISTLFPEGSIRYLNRSLFLRETGADVPYSFTIIQCLVFLGVTVYLLKKTMRAIERHD